MKHEIRFFAIITILLSFISNLFLMSDGTISPVYAIGNPTPTPTPNCSDVSYYSIWVWQSVNPPQDGIEKSENNDIAEVYVGRTLEFKCADIIIPPHNNFLLCNQGQYTWSGYSPSGTITYQSPGAGESVNIRFNQVGTYTITCNHSGFTNCQGPCGSSYGGGSASIQVKVFYPCQRPCQPPQGSGSNMISVSSSSFWHGQWDDQEDEESAQCDGVLLKSTYSCSQDGCPATLQWRNLDARAETSYSFYISRGLPAVALNCTCYAVVASRGRLGPNGNFHSVDEGINFTSTPSVVSLSIPIWGGISVTLTPGIGSTEGSDSDSQYSNTNSCSNDYVLHEPNTPAVFQEYGYSAIGVMTFCDQVFGFSSCFMRANADASITINARNPQTEWIFSF